MGIIKNVFKKIIFSVKAKSKKEVFYMALIKLLIGISSILGAGVLQIFSIAKVPMLIAEGSGVIGSVLVFIASQFILAAGIVLIVHRHQADEISPLVLYFLSAGILFVPYSAAIRLAIVVLIVAIGLLVDLINFNKIYID